MWFILFIFASISRCNVFFGLPLLSFPSGFQVSACFAIQFGDFLNVCPIHFRCVFLISSSAGSWFVLSHSGLLLMVSSQRTLSNLRRQLFISICTFVMMMVVVVLQVSAPYSRTVLTFVLKILTLILVDSCLDFHMFFDYSSAAFAKPILAFTSTSDPPCSSVMLLRYVKVSISSRASPLSGDNISWLPNDLIAREKDSEP